MVTLLFFQTIKPDLGLKNPYSISRSHFIRVGLFFFYFYSIFKKEKEYVAWKRYECVATACGAQLLVEGTRSEKLKSIHLILDFRFHILGFRFQRERDRERESDDRE